jgi:hypothetical protein
MIVGPVWTIGRFFRHEWRSLRRNKPNVRRVWLEHLLWCVPVVLWLKFVCGIPLWIYVMTMVLPATAIVLIRSFAEHRALPGVRERIAIVEPPGSSVRCSCSTICTRSTRGSASPGIATTPAIAGFASGCSPKMAGSCM